MAELRPTKPRVEIIEVSPRDGLQSEDVVVPTATKLGLIDRALAAGVTRIEVASFVRADRVPQMADAEAVMAGVTARLASARSAADAAGTVAGVAGRDGDGAGDRDRPGRPGVAFVGLVLNRRGLDRALGAEVGEVNVVVVCTDEFGRRNQGRTRDESLDVFEDLAAAAHEHGVRVTATLSTAFGCPFEGAVPAARVAEVAARAAAAGADEITLADTIGAAGPDAVVERVEGVRAAVGDVALRAHLHNSRNTGLANAYAAVQAGVRRLDASLGGIGGCPFAPGAAGNIPTEDLAHLLTRSGFDTGLDLDALLAAVRWIEEILGRPLPGQLARAGPFPRPAGA